MAAAAMYSYVCKQDDSLFINKPNLRENRVGGRCGFYIKARVRYQRENPDDVEVLLSDNFSYFSFRDEFLSGNEGTKRKLFVFLLSRYLPMSFYESTVNELIQLARTMVQDPKIAVDILIRSEAQAIERARLLERVDKSRRENSDRARAIEAAGASRERVTAEVLEQSGFFRNPTITLADLRLRLANRIFDGN